MTEPTILTLDSTLDASTATTLLYGADQWGDVRQLWREALRHKRPVRTQAELMGIELPDPDIGLWRSAFPSLCFLCSRTGDWRGMQVHHIERKGQVHNEREDWIVNLFLCCARCHEGPLATMKHCQQLAAKWRHDHAGFASLDEFLRRWLMVKDFALKAPGRVEVCEVEHFLKRAA